MAEVRKSRAFGEFHGMHPRRCWLRTQENACYILLDNWIENLPVLVVTPSVSFPLLPVCLFADAKQDMWVTRAEFREHGPSIMDSKSL